MQIQFPGCCADCFIAAFVATVRVGFPLEEGKQYIMNNH